jgi:hypothetical protein
MIMLTLDANDIAKARITTYAVGGSEATFMPSE